MTELISPANLGIEAKNRLSGVSSVLFIAWALLFGQGADAQTFTVLHNFTDGLDGGVPKVGLSMDQAGNLYGTTSVGGNKGSSCHAGLAPAGCGTAFKLTHSGSGWTFTSIYRFQGLADGSPPSSRVIVGPDGALYGTTLYGGLLSCDPSWNGCGVVYKLRPQPTLCRSVPCPWIETPAYTFQSTTEGNNPEGDLIFDAQGNIYGTTNRGGYIGYGVVFELTRASGGGWSENVLYAFPGLTLDRPQGGAIFDRFGNLYGTADCNNCQSGGIFQLTPSGSGWTEKDLYIFDFPYPGDAVPGGLVIDQSDHLFGGTIWGGQTNFGIVYELNQLPDGHWDANTVYTFAQASGGPYANLTMDAAGNLYGTAYGDGAHRMGSVFKLTPSPNGWIYTDLHDFDGSHGAKPISSVLLEANGNLYGTTSAGGSYGYGVVWEITP